MRIALTIAGSDPSGGAGIQRDLETFARFKMHGISVITALTAQNPKRVAGVLPVPALFVRKQIEILIEEYEISAVKTGMLVSDSIVRVLSKIFKTKIKNNIVIDPVFVSTSGCPLLEKKGIFRLKDELIPIATIVTPNIQEAEALSGIKIKGQRDMHLAAERIARLGCKSVLVKGGHLFQISNLKSQISNDVFYNGKVFKAFSSPRVNTDLHGTGCILSAGIAAGLAKGIDIQDSIRTAKRYVTRLIKTGGRL